MVSPDSSLVARGDSRRTFSSDLVEFVENVEHVGGEVWVGSRRGHEQVQERAGSRSGERPQSSAVWVSHIPHDLGVRVSWKARPRSRVERVNREAPDLLVRAPDRVPDR